jgi:hypothetical protein
MKKKKRREKEDNDVDLFSCQEDQNNQKNLAKAPV